MKKEKKLEIDCALFLFEQELNKGEWCAEKKMAELREFVERKITEHGGTL